MGSDAVSGTPGGTGEHPDGSGERAVERDRSCLVSMQECIRQIQHYAAGGRTAFMASTMVQDAVFWNLQLLSASALRVSDEHKGMHPEVDWKRAAALFRDTLGDPWRPEPERVWERIEADLAELGRGVQKLLRSNDVRVY